MVQDTQSNSILAPEALSSRVNYTVLVIDDDRTSHKILEKILKKDELGCHSFSSAIEALANLEAISPDLILCDISMPEMDGIEFCSLLRKHPIFNETPLIFFTGLSDAETITRAFEIGANDYVVKPIRAAEVISRTRLHLNEAERSKHAKAQITKLDQQNKSKSHFLGIASHDLRNPLVSIRGISQYLESEKFGTLNEDQKELVQTVIQASETMLTLVEELLDVSLLETTQDRTQFEDEDLNEIAKTGATLHSASADKKHIRLAAQIESSPAILKLDRKLISRLLDNLISNAIKFSFPETKVTIRVERSENDTHLILDDEGPGIPADEFNKLFKEFSRTSNQPTAGESSSGIGLYVCKQIAETHGAIIEVANRPEGGARFSVKFPNN